MSTVDLASKKKMLSSRSHAYFWSLEGLLLGLSFSRAIMCCWSSVFVTISVHLTTCHCHNVLLEFGFCYNFCAFDNLPLPFYLEWKLEMLQPTRQLNMHSFALRGGRLV
jgi:hypothetical protein